MRLIHSCLSALALLLAFSPAGWGQGFPSYSPPPMPMPNNMGMNMNMYNYGPGPGYREGPGSYQLPDGSWHRASQLKFDGTTLVVKDEVMGKQKFKAERLQQFEVARDTFLVARELPGREALGPNFVESQLNQRGYRVWALYASGGVAFSRPRYFLSRPQATLQLLPGSKKEFKAAVLALVAACPAVAGEVTDGSLGRNDLAAIIRLYLDCHVPAGAASDVK